MGVLYCLPFSIMIHNRKKAKSKNCRASVDAGCKFESHAWLDLMAVVCFPTSRNLKQQNNECCLSFSPLQKKKRCCGTLWGGAEHCSRVIKTWVTNRVEKLAQRIRNVSKSRKINNFQESPRGDGELKGHSILLLVPFKCFPFLGVFAFSFSCRAVLSCRSLLEGLRSIFQQ